MLPDVALLEIFESYMDQVRQYGDYNLERYARWYSLVHVCQKWRRVIFGSPRRLGLRLYCTSRTPVKDTLAVWPPLPIAIRLDHPRALDNFFAALEHNDRVSHIVLRVSDSQWEEVLAAMQQPFTVLTKFSIWPSDHWRRSPVQVVPESFLGGSAPRLQSLDLARISFPGLAKLLLTATGLVSLDIWKIPHSGYISPEEMVRCLSTLTRLEDLTIGFESPLSRPVQETRSPPTRSVLPALTRFHFDGVSEYLEDFVARIDAPLLHTLEITFFHQLIFDTPQLAQFIARTPNIQPPVEAQINFIGDSVRIRSPSNFDLWISCRQVDWQLSSLTQVFGSSFPEAFFSTVESLYFDDWVLSYWQDDIEDSQWLEVLHPFTAVKHLYLTQGFTSRIGPALQEVVGEVLPSLQKLFLQDLHNSEPVQGPIGKFVAARQLASHPIAVSRWDRKPYVFV
jgi:hypothetical protein